MYNRKRIALVLVIFLCIAGFVAWFLLGRASDKPAPAQNQPAGSAVKGEATAFDRDLYSLGSPESPWVIVNKQRPLQPLDYAPGLSTPAVPLRLDGSNPEMQLSNQITEPVETMFAAAKTAGLELMLASGYRSYKQQITVYNAEVRRNGQQAADRESARPGHSEHQTGLALDIEPASRSCEVEACFADTPEGKWLADNAYKYGFVIRYAEGKESITGYTYEPWHLRYVGKALANELRQLDNPTLETFFNLGAAPDYKD